MEIEENHNPNSHERLKSWSELPPDLLISLFERLSFASFQRAKSVCSSWHSASRQCVRKKNHMPWLILFPEDNNKNTSCTLFNPEEKDKLYRTQDLDLELPRIFCLQTYGSWLLMRNRLHNLYLVNLFTHERINLPPAESQRGMIKMERIVDDGVRITSPNGRELSNRMHIQSPVFWIDEKTKDHVVLWGLGRCCVVYSKKGDNSWNQIQDTSDCCDMVYKDHKLYLLRYSNFKIFDFSGEIPQQTFYCGGVNVERYMFGRQRGQPSNSRRLFAIKLVVTVTGDVLKVERWLRPVSRIWSFRLYKVYSLGLFKRLERVDSLGDEAMLLDLGITVLANNNEGISRNSIYFGGSDDENTNDIFLFNLETRKMEQLHKFDCSSFQLSRNRWFLPSFTQA